MYTKIKNVQILVSLLKQHNIRHLVLSAGTRHVPLAHSVENDDFFKCYFRNTVDVVLVTIVGELSIGAAFHELACFVRFADGHDELDFEVKKDGNVLRVLIPCKGLRVFISKAPSNPAIETRTTVVLRKTASEACFLAKYFKG